MNNNAFLTRSVVIRRIYSANSLIFYVDLYVDLYIYVIIFLDKKGWICIKHKQPAEVNFSDSDLYVL